MKLETLAGLLGSFLFLPLLSPLCLLALLPLAARFWNSNHNYWTLHYHYSLTIAPILAFAAADALERLRRRGQRRRALAVATTCALATAAAVTATTLAGWRMSGLSSSASAATGRCLAAIPADASVAASDTLVPHLSRRSRIYTLRNLARGARPDVLALNRRANPDERLPAAVRRLAARRGAAGYRVACTGGGTLVLAGTGAEPEQPVAGHQSPVGREPRRVTEAAASARSRPSPP